MTEQDKDSIRSVDAVWVRQGRELGYSKSEIVEFALLCRFDPEEITDAHREFAAVVIQEILQ